MTEGAQAVKVGLSIGSGVSALEHLDPRELAADGFASVFVACYEDEMRWHAQTAADFSRACQAAGLEVYAVPLGYGRVIDPDPSTESLYVRAHPQNLQVDTRGRRALKACPNNPGFLEWFSSNMRTLAWLLECDGFLWDEPTFYYARGAWACRCTWCQRLFHARHQKPMPAELTDEVVRFRQDALLMFLLAATAAIQAVDRRLVSVVMPTTAGGSREFGLATDRLEPLARHGAVGAISVYVPWQSAGRDLETALCSAQEEVSTVAGRHRKRSLLWIGGSPHPRDRLLDALGIAARAGVKHLVIAGDQTLTASAAYPRFRAALSREIARVR